MNRFKKIALAAVAGIALPGTSLASAAPSVESTKPGALKFYQAAESAPGALGGRHIVTLVTPSKASTQGGWLRILPSPSAKGHLSV
jgi:hypothetical protein